MQEELVGIAFRVVTSKEVRSSHCSMVAEVWSSSSSCCCCNSSMGLVIEPAVASRKDCNSARMEVAHITVNASAEVIASVAATATIEVRKRVSILAIS